MFLALSAALFSLVALELSATIKKSTEEGHLAFLISRILSSEPRVLSERIQGLVKRRDSKGLQALLGETRIAGRMDGNLENLESLEVSLARDFEDHYNIVLYYSPDDLKEFFKKCRILWDVENLKLLLCHVLAGSDSEGCVRAVGPYGYMDFGIIESLAKSKSAEELLKNSAKVLPVEFSSAISLEKWTSVNELEFSLDLAAFEYLRQSSEQIGTRRVKLAWGFMMDLYEVENIVTAARLKRSKIVSEYVTRFLFPSQRRLDKSEITRLVEADDYEVFLRALGDTYFGKFLPSGVADPTALEESLTRALLTLDLGETQQGMGMISRFLSELETQYDTIRKGAFLVSIKAYDEE
jgi:vacuolar-type H+-ATPase subunit C/Vma6